MDALVVLSGGQDSTTCLFLAKQQYEKIHAITFDYGQKHAIEIESAKRIAKLAGVASHEILTLGDSILKGSSPLTNKSETLEQYDDYNSLPGGLEKTFVPGRNLLFLAIAANRASVLGCDAIITGICQEDSGGYPDCRESFRIFIEQAIKRALGTPDTPNVIAPLMDLDKAATVRLAFADKDCWHALAFSHTSYDGAYPPTGHDHATLLRAKGFAEAGLPDPLILRAHYEGLMTLPLAANYGPGLWAIKDNRYATNVFDLEILHKMYSVVGIMPPAKHDRFNNPTFGDYPKPRSLNHDLKETL